MPIIIAMRNTNIRNHFESAAAQWVDLPNVILCDEARHLQRALLSSVTNIKVLIFLFSILIVVLHNINVSI